MSASTTAGRWALTLALVAMFGLGTPRAGADTGIVVVGGSADDHARATAGAAVESVAREVGWSLASKQLSKKESEGLFACKDPKLVACLPSSLGASGIHHVLVVTVDLQASDGGGSQFVIVGRLVGASPQDFAFNRHYCDQCADDRLQDESMKLAREILRQNATQSGRTVLEITSDPPGAAVVLDGQRVGITDGTYNTFPGPHVVVLEKPGFVSETKRFDVAEGKTAAVAVTLRASAVQKPVGPAPASHAVPVTVGSVGVAALVTGIVLYAFDEQPSPTGGKQYLDTEPAAITVGVVGLAAIGVGAYLWYRASHSSSGPTAALVRDGAVVGWTGRF